MKHDLDDILDIELSEEEDRKLPLVPQKPTTDVDADTDMKFIRSNMYDLIEKGQLALDELLAIANQSQHPRSYEVLSNLIKTIADTNSDLLKIHERKNKISPTEDRPGTVNNNLFVGSTSELQRMLKDLND